MSILQIIIIFATFCVVWILTNLINQIIIGRAQLRLQRQRIDEAYLQLSRLVIRTAAEIKGKERVNHDNL